ncbi:glycosyl hydrolase 108 family protein [Fervidobacterium sp.]
MDKADKTERLEVILIYAIIFGVILLINGVVYLAIAKARHISNNPTNQSIEVYNSAITTDIVNTNRNDEESATNSENKIDSEILDKYKELEKEIEELKNALAIQRTVEYVIYSVVDYEGGTLTYDELGGTTKYGIASRFHPDINVYGLTRKDAFNILYARYYLPNRLYKFQSVRIQVALMHMCVLFGNRAFSIAYSTVPKERLITLRDSDADFPVIVEKLRIAFREHALRLGLRNTQYLKGWLNRIEKVFYIG